MAWSHKKIQMKMLITCRLLHHVFLITRLLLPLTLPTLLILIKGIFLMLLQASCMLCMFILHNSTLFTQNLFNLKVPGMLYRQTLEEVFLIYLLNKGTLLLIGNIIAITPLNTMQLLVNLQMVIFYRLSHI